MKNMKRLISFAVIFAAFATATFAQGVTASATATATIITPITIASTTQMNFGNIAVNATPGTVQLSVTSTRTPGGGVTLPTPAGTVTAAVFHVTGITGSTYSITLPGNAPAYTITSGANNMTITDFISNPAANGSLATGAEDISVGATLNVGASQAAGVYTNATGFDVTVNYN